MGNNPTHLQSNTQHQNSIIVDHSHLGVIQTTNNPKYSDCYLKIYHFADEMMGQQKLRRFNARMKKFANSQYILSIRSAEMIPKHEMCSHNCDINLYFEKYDYSLKSILASRLKEKKIFQQQQIYQFINQVLEALIFLQDNGFKNCQLDKESIVFCQRKVKLIDLGIATNNPFQNFLDKLQPIQGFYIAPELFRDLKQKNYQPYMSPKSDVFCLGMIILELACMEPLDNYYNFQKYTIDYESLIHRVSKIVYSVQLKTLIAGMLQYESDLRLGLISAQQKVRKALHLDTLEQQKQTAKRSRSSSTKMLKQLLVNSRKTLTVSHKQSDKKSLNKKPSNSSLTSITSLNSRNSVNMMQNKQKQKRYNHQRKQSDMYPSKQQASFLKDLVKTKTQTSRTVIEKQIGQNKQNNTNVINKQLKIESKAQPEIKNNLKLIQQARNQTFASNTFLGNNYSYQHERRFDSNTPKVNEYLSRINKLKKEESIFKLILEQSDCVSNKSKSQNCNTTSNAPDCSPVPPVIPKVTQTNSIKRSTPIEQIIRQVAQFNDQISQPKQISQKKIQQYPEQSLSLRVKKSLDKMYKTTQSITHSQEKQISNFLQKSHYRKVFLPNNYLYEGQVRQDEIFQGNGVLYNSRGQIVYSGSWVNGLYEGFGTLHNSQQIINCKVDYRNLQNCHNWIKYEGQFVKGERQGFGTIYYSTGQRFAGCMRNGQINGYGCFYNNFNQMMSGVWVNNRLQC